MRASGLPDDSSKAADIRSVAGIELELPGAPPARFRLLWDQAPRTCAAVVPALPDTAECLHAIYSGTVAAFFFDPSVVAPRETATTCLIPGDLGLYALRRRSASRSPGTPQRGLLAL